jgi:hypothetical protein
MHFSKFRNHQQRALVHKDFDNGIFYVMSFKLKKSYGTAVLATLVGFSALGQGPGDLPPPPPPPGLVVPIDKNLIVLAIVGFLLGIYVVAKIKKRDTCLNRDL